MSGESEAMVEVLEFLSASLENPTNEDGGEPRIVIVSEGRMSVMRSVDLEPFDEEGYVIFETEYGESCAVRPEDIRRVALTNERNLVQSLRAVAQAERIGGARLH